MKGRFEMAEVADLLQQTGGAADEDSAKRRQIVDGARHVFLAKGFDAASMMDIAKAAGVSKGTLYVYFKNKEELFAAIVQTECGNQAETTFSLDSSDHDVERVLTRLGIEYLHFLCKTEKASSLRIVIAIADRMPEIGRIFYETGPLRGALRLSEYLDAQVRAGVLAVENCEIAATQFLDACQSTLFKPLLFNFAPPPSEARVRKVVGIAVKTFLAAYARPTRN
jgi:AcrR family transcriptional regulator